jgi:folate-binding protein YgfZ
MSITISSNNLILDWPQIKITGKDAQAFLNRQTTNNVLQISNFQFNCLTDNHGKLISVFIIQKIQNDFFLYVERHLLEKTLQRLNQFLVSEDVEITTTEKKLMINFDFNSENYFWGIAANVECVKSIEVNTEEKVYKDIRLQSGHLRIGIEIPENELINNTPYVRFVSFSKGCYPGQETVNKIFNNRGAASFPVAYKVDQLNKSINSWKKNNENIATFIASFNIYDQEFKIINLKREYRIYNQNIELDEGIFRFLQLPIIPEVKEERIEFFVELAQNYFLEGKEEVALLFFNEALSLDPNNIEILERTGVLLGRLTKYDEAISKMNKILEINPITPMAHTNLSVYYMKIGKIEEAEKHKNEAVTKSFQFFAKKSQDEKNALLEKENKKKELFAKLEMFKQVLEIDQEDSFALLGSAQIYFELNNIDETENTLNNLLKTEPENYKALLLKARVLDLRNDKEESKNFKIKSQKIAMKRGDQKFLSENLRFFNL